MGVVYHGVIQNRLYRYLLLSTTTQVCNELCGNSCLVKQEYDVQPNEVKDFHIQYLKIFSQKEVTDSMYKHLPILKCQCLYLQIARK